VPTFKLAGDLFLLFLQLLLLLCHHLLLMSNGNCLLVEVLPHLDVGLAMGLSRGVQLFGNSLLIEQELHPIQLLPPHRCSLPFRGDPLLEQGTPLHVALLFLINIGPLSLEHFLRLAQHEMSHSIASERETCPVAQSRGCPVTTLSASPSSSLVMLASAAVVHATAAPDWVHEEAASVFGSVMVGVVPAAVAPAVESGSGAASPPPWDAGIVSRFVARQHAIND
jgi:hypothetical protein